MMFPARGIALVAVLLLGLGQDGMSFSEDGESYFKLKSYISSQSAEYCLHLDQFTNKIYVQECVEGNRLQIWKVDDHSRIHNERPNKRAGCIFRDSPGSIIYKQPCGSPTEATKFVYNLFDSKILNGFKAMTIPKLFMEGAEVGLKKPRAVLLGQKWKVDFIPLDEQLKLVNNPCGEESNDGLCSICEGDCDDDHDCRGALRCGQRRFHNGREEVPGCFFGEDSDVERYQDYDYCFQPVDVSESSIVNYVGQCSSNSYRCKQCEGTCLSDDHCEYGLLCHRREGFEAVPGCTGEGGELDMYGKNICFDPHLPLVKPAEANCTDFNNCTECSLSCGNDEDCGGDLRCAIMDSGYSVPGCHIADSAFLGENVCFRALSFPGNAGVINYVGQCNNQTYYCERCEAGCTTSDDCAGSLVCLERDAMEPVPGCFHPGGYLDVSGKNVCYDGDLHKSELSWYGDHCTRTFGHYGCPECTGGCWHDSDCYGNLRCAVRDGLEDVPGCRWGSSSNLRQLLEGQYNFCFTPIEAPGVVNYAGECSIEGYLCDVCEGNCKLDSDCQFDYVCLHRSGFEEVPGCTMEGGPRDMYGKGICYDPSSFSGR